MSAERARRSALAAKRLLDVVVAGGALAGAAPLLAAITVADALLIGWPPWFSQERTGHRGKPFTIYKFRTMTSATDASGKLLPDAERVTPFGRWLRSTSLDELPELVNVLKGEMSLVGPRPLMHIYHGRYSPEQMRRHEVPPGVTGWAAVNGRGAITWEEKFALDLWYVENWSLALDLRIIAKTLLVVLRREGIGPQGEVSAPEFLGSDSNVER